MPLDAFASVRVTCTDDLGEYSPNESHTPRKNYYKKGRLKVLLQMSFWLAICGSILVVNFAQAAPSTASDFLTSGAPVCI